MRESTQFSTAKSLIYNCIKQAGREGISSKFLYSSLDEIFPLDVYIAIVSTLKKEGKIKENALNKLRAYSSRNGKDYPCSKKGGACSKGGINYACNYKKTYI